jgi:hypothetical protein
MQSCKDCRHWTPDLFFTYLGRCPEKGMVTEGHMPPCEAFAGSATRGTPLVPGLQDDGARGDRGGTRVTTSSPGATSTRTRTS